MSEHMDETLWKTGNELSIEQITADVLSVITDHVSVELHPDSKYTDLQIDSLELVHVMMKLEEHFHVLIPNEESAKFKTIAETVSYIQKALKTKVVEH